MIRSTTRRQLILVVMVALSLALALPLTVFTPIKAHAQAAAQETLTAPFTNGPNGATTTNSYSGTVTINISGTGQASATAYSDAFYIYTDNAGNPITPDHNSAFGLCINNQPVDNYVSGIPPYSSDHTYQFTITAPGGQLTFGVCDTYTSDNTGSFTITITSSGSGPTVTVQKVWTTDGSNKTLTTFAPGDTIRYRAQVKNTNSTTVTATFTFLATGPQQIYSWTGSKSVASGTPIITMASNVPTNASAGTYTLIVTVTYQGMSSSMQSTFVVVLQAASNWAGYLSEGKQTYSEVKGSWQVPKAKCSKGESSLSGFWVGLDGFKNLGVVGWLEQIGTASGCTNGQPYYYAFWELIEPGIVSAPTTINHQVLQGDSMDAIVQFVGLDALNRPQFLLTIHDSTQKWGFSIQQGDTFVGSPRNSAECIAEHPVIFKLTDFGKVNFTGCKADGNPINNGPITVQLNDIPLTLTGPLTNGTDFTVTWKNS